MDVLSWLFPLFNVIVFLGLAPLYEGVLRRLAARVQSRRGPPIVQPYYDLFKLLGKERVDSAKSWPFRAAPLGAFAAVLVVVALIPFGGRLNALSGFADSIAVIYMMTFSGVFILLGALASRNTFALIGASREMVTMIMVEPVLAMTLVLGAVKLKSLGLAAAMPGAAGAGFTLSTGLMLAVYLLALQAFAARQPFDISEAEIEILEGPFIEYSGPDYALFSYAMMMKRMFYAWLFVSAFLPWLRTGTPAADVPIQLLAMLAVFVLIGLVGTTNPRFRIDQAVRYYAVLIVLALVNIGLSVKGW